MRNQTLAQAQLHTQLLAQLQTEIPSSLVNYGSVTFLSNPVQYISGLAHGFQGDIAMCKSILLMHVRRCHQVSLDHRAAEISRLVLHLNVRSEAYMS